MSFKPAALVQRLRSTAQEFMDEPGLALKGRISTLHRFVHFWVVVSRSFVRNRCPVRASALSYTTLLALVPLLAVIFGVTSSLLKSDGEQRITRFIDGFVASVTPPAVLGTNQPEWREFIGPLLPGGNGEAQTAPTNTPGVASANQAGGTNSAALLQLVQDETVVAARKEAAKWLNEFVQNTRSGTLGATGTILLIFVVISLMARIEETFNDIWGVTQGRTWFMRIITYWAAVTLGPLLMIGGLALMSSAQADTIRNFIAQTAFVGNLIFKVLPLFIVWLAFTTFYQLMPATKVQWSAAAVGGLCGGMLWFLNNYFAFLYISRVVSSFKIYGSLGLVPVFMVGLYFSWLILLFGAQVAYAFQNREAYLQARLVENINQRGREFVALRLMTAISQRFQMGQPPATVGLLSSELAVPGRLVQQVLGTLLAARLVVEVNAGRELGYMPARPLADINCHDLLRALRVTAGQDLATEDKASHAEVLGEFARIEAAEQQAASSVTMLALANRAAALQIAPPDASSLSIPLKAATLPTTAVEDHSAERAAPSSEVPVVGPAATTEPAHLAEPRPPSDAVSQPVQAPKAGGLCRHADETPAIRSSDAPAGAEAVPPAEPAPARPTYQPAEQPFPD
jgi:membrane protein